MTNNTDVAESVGKLSPSVQKHSLFKLQQSIFEFIYIENPLSSIDEKTVNTTSAIVSFGYIKDMKEEFAPRILHYLHIVLASRLVPEDLVVEAMATLLRNNPKYFKQYMDHTYREKFAHFIIQQKRLEEAKHETPEAKKKKEPKKKDKDEFDEILSHSGIITSCYMKAICKVMDNLIDIWVENGITNYGQLLFHGLLHSTAEEYALRNAAHELLYILLSSEHTKLKPGVTFNFTTTEDQSSYEFSLYSFCDFLATLSADLSTDLLVEASNTIDFVSNENRKNILAIIRPWAYNYGKVLAKNIQGDRVKYSLLNEVPNTFIISLSSITKRLHNEKDSVYKQLFSNIWFEVMKSRVDCKWVVHEVLKFITSGLREIYACTFNTIIFRIHFLDQTKCNTL